MADREFSIKTMSRDELDIAIEWAAAEGWNPGLHDADTYYTTDPTGFLIGYLGDEPIAVISAVKYGKHFGFLGFAWLNPSIVVKGMGSEFGIQRLSILKVALLVSMVL